MKLSDGGGLQFWLWPDGAKRWRLAYRFDGAQKTLALGVYPEVGLKDAREARDAPIVKPRAVIVDPKPFGGLLRAIEDYDGTTAEKGARSPRLRRGCFLGEG